MPSHHGQVWPLNEFITHQITTCDPQLRMFFWFKSSCHVKYEQKRIWWTVFGLKWTSSIGRSDGKTTDSRLVVNNQAKILQPVWHLPVLLVTLQELLFTTDNAKMVFFCRAVKIIKERLLGRQCQTSPAKNSPFLSLTRYAVSRLNGSRGHAKLAALFWRNLI